MSENMNVYVICTLVVFIMCAKLDKFVAYNHPRRDATHDTFVCNANLVSLLNFVSFSTKSKRITIALPYS